MIPKAQLDAFAQALQNANVSLIDLIVAYISEPEPTEAISALQQQLRSPPTLNALVHVLLNTSQTAPIITQIAQNIAVRTYACEMHRLLSPSAGFQFNVAHAAPSQFSAFSSMKMASTFEELCPGVWKLFGALLNVVAIQKEATLANNRGDYLTELTYRNKADKPPLPQPELSVRDAVSDEAADMPDEDWGMHVDEDLLEDERRALEAIEGQTGEVWSAHTGAPWQKAEGKALKRRIARTHVRRLLLFSMCMNSSNMRCNALLAIVGMFAHSTNTSERMIEFLSHAGLSIAPSSINLMINQMSTNAQNSLRNELSDFLSAIGYDNLEVRFDTEQPTPENPGQLVSMTTAAFFPLRPGTNKEDLRVCKELWARSEFNPYRSLPPVVYSHDRLMSLLLKPSVAPEDEKSLESLFAWHVRNILLNENLETISTDLKELFRKESLGLPAQRSWTPHSKTTQKMMRTMDISVSTIHGNAAAIERILQTGGAIRELLEEFILLIHADLGGGEKLLSLQESRAIEADAWDRLQFLIFLPGWFHIRMAMADAMHRLWMYVERSRTGHATHPHSLFHLCTLLCPREIIKMGNKPGFRRTHSLIEHLSLATIADAWRLVVQSKYGVNLQEWRPTWEEVVTTSRQVVSEYVAGLSYRPTHLSGDGGDMVQDQIRLFNQNALLYLSITRAARYGDIRRVQDLLPMWIYIWRQTGKHKYAHHLTRFVINLDGGWPTKLSRVVQQNWLANPTGKIDGFRGVDWIIERDNYFQKRLYSGSSSNRTPEHLRKESVLIEENQAVHGIMERNFHLAPQTMLHPPPIMKTSLNIVRNYLEGEKMSSHQSGRVFSSPPINAVAGGVAKATRSAGALTDDEEGAGAEGGDGSEIELGDLAVEE
ncbi:hypothetical protein FRC09_002576 [Ceratobasidium sp. 395]|nr:hypothetical protein FRC09_002576 [Ceratobasidium sp. 395]